MCIKAHKTRTSKLTGTYDVAQKAERNFYVYKAFIITKDGLLRCLLFRRVIVDNKGNLTRPKRQNKKDVTFSKRMSFQCFYYEEHAELITKGIFGIEWRNRCVIKRILVPKGAKFVIGTCENSCYLTNGIPALRIEKGIVQDYKHPEA